MGSKAQSFSAQLREMFPEARMLCYCARERDVCPADCTNMRAQRERIRRWADEQAV